jgi:hypothetical protein
MDAQREIHISHYSPGRPGDRCAARDLERRYLRGNSPGTGGLFGEGLFAAAYRSQLKVRTQKAGESWQDFATAIQQLARRAYPASREEHIRKEAGKAFVEVIQEYEIKIRLLLGGEKTLSEELRQALEIHTVLIAARSERSNNGASSWTRSPPPHPTERRKAFGKLELQEK